MSDKEITNAIAVDGAVYERYDHWDLQAEQHDPEFCEWEFVGWELPVFDWWEKGIIFNGDDYTHMCAREEDED